MKRKLYFINNEEKGESSDKIDQNKNEIVTEIGSLREDLRTYMAEKLTKIEQDVEAIKVKIGMV